MRRTSRTPPTISVALRGEVKVKLAALLATAGVWLQRADVRAALAATVALRVVCSLTAALIPAFSPNLYPWHDPFLAQEGIVGQRLLASPRPIYNLGDYLTQPWNRWDTIWYTSVATQGYAKYGSTIYTPLFPGLMRLLAPVFAGNYVAAGLFISTVAAFFCFLGLFRLAMRLAPVPKIGAMVLVVACLLPTSFYLMAAYTEALFLALTLFAMLATLDRNWWHVAMLGAAGALTREQGVFIGLLAVPSLLILLWQERHTLRNVGGAALIALRRAFPLGAAIAAPLVAYAAWVATLVFVLHVPPPWKEALDTAVWNVRVSWPWQGLWADARLLFFPGGPLHLQGSVPEVVLDLVMSVGALVALVVMARRLPASLLLYLSAMWWTSLSKVYGNGLTISEGRYMLQLLPLCILAASWLAQGRDWRRLAWVAVSLPIMLLYLWAFVMYLWVA
jgi:hypothetical protein